MVKKLLTLQSTDYSAVLTPYHDNGLFANVLQVCDALLLTKPGLPVLVDWKRKGAEGHFQYGPQGFDLFEHLFEASDRCRSAPAAPADGLSMPGRINCLFMNMLRGYFWSLPDDSLNELRLRYAAAMRVLQPSQHVQCRLEGCAFPVEEDTCVVGVHKRLACSEMVACQLSQRAPSCAEFIAKARKIFSASEKTRKLVFLATDDSQAAEDFQLAFPTCGDVQLCYRSEVKRSQGGVREDGVDNEVHRNPCVEADAEDALIDALCLSRCQHLVCVDSNLAIYVALLNPSIQLHALSSILPEGWEDAAGVPEEDVYASYEVVFAPMVFVRKGPSTATELMGARKPGEIVHCTGRCFDGWVELEEGGWMLVDGARGGKQNAAAGTLLKPVGQLLTTPQPATENKRIVPQCTSAIHDVCNFIEGRLPWLPVAEAWQSAREIWLALMCEVSALQQQGGNLEMAEATLTEVLTEVPNCSRALLRRGLIREALGNLLGARQDLSCAAAENFLDTQVQASRYDTQVLREYLLEQEEGSTRQRQGEEADQATLPDVYDLRQRCFRRIRALLVVNFLAYWSTLSYCAYSFYLRVEEVGTKALPPMEVALACVFLLGTQATLELAAAVCLTQPVRLGDGRSNAFSSWDVLAWLAGAGARCSLLLDALCLPLMKRGSSLLFLLSASTFAFAIGVFVFAVQLRLLFGMFCSRDHFSYDKPDLFFKGRDGSGLMEGTPIAARPPAHREEEDTSDLRLGRAMPVNTIKAANFAHFNDLALLHLVLRRHYLPISCQETQEFTLSITSFSRCFCEDVVQCSLKFFFIMDCQVNLLMLFSLLVSIGQAACARSLRLLPN
ncbi:kmo [Symbiodinium pilosum]|uniref:Kmo protein n=1 Tax=Symbiodinium pilosum TaxID=2952 RepID=A0A812LRJ3_SYMPI|nr:kmo [Symbiodinium pilosum]